MPAPESGEFREHKITNLTKDDAMSSSFIPTTDDEKTYCTVHPTVESGLRCNRCGRYMCVRCAVHTPVGYRCRQCVNQQQDGFYKAERRDYLLGVATAFGIGLVTGFIVPRLMLFGVLILSFPAGVLIGEAVWRVTGRRRGKYMRQAVIAAIVISCLIGLIPVWQEIGPVVSAVLNPQVGRGAEQLRNQLIGELVGTYLLPSLFYMGMASIMASSRLK